MGTAEPYSVQPGPARFGPLLRRFRLAAGLSQEALAERAGLSVAGLSALENGRRQAPYHHTITLLAKAMCLSDAETTALEATIVRTRVPALTPASAPGDQAPPAGEAGTAAPLRLPAPQPPRTNLPAALSSLIGREREQGAVRALLEAARLVTVIGAGGAGKTRLALAVAAVLVEEYPDGVWLVELAPLADPALVPQAVSQALVVQEEPDRPLLATLVDSLKDRQMLLLLDNCEHLVDACAELAVALLRACPALRILATSREGLVVDGERLYRVPSLAVPPLDPPPPPLELGTYPSVRLFVARAQERRADFALNAHNGRAVAQVCARLDGMPLAIELAAARVGGLPVAAIAARLDDRFRLLITGPRTALPRQQTLRATLDWSYDLLGEGERRLLDRLSAFAAGCTLTAAEAVCSGEGIEEWEVLDLLGSLVNKSLVLLEERAEDPEGGGRYRLLETVRQYGWEQLHSRGEEAARVRDRLLGWCLTLAEEAEPQLTGPDQVHWFSRLEAEHDNLRAALAWGLERGDAGRGLQLAGALWRFWEFHGHQSEGRRWLGEALAHCNAAVVPVALSARVRTGAGVLAWRLGDDAGAQALLAAALALRRELGDREGIAASLQHLGNVAVGQGDHARARALHEEGLALFRDLGDRGGIAWSFCALGNVAKRQGENAGARALLEESLALFRDLGDSQGIATSMEFLADVAYAEDDHALAQALLEQALALYRELGDRGGVAYAQHRLAKVAHAQGNHAGARALLAAALALRRELGDRRGVALSIEGFARLAGAQGQPRRAAQLWGAADNLRQAIGVPRWPVEQAEYEQAIVTLCATLSEEDLAAGWAEGRALPLEEAIALAGASSWPASGEDASSRDA